MFHYLIVSQKQWKRVPKRVTKVTVTKNEICNSAKKATIQLSSCSKCCSLS